MLEYVANLTDIKRSVVERVLAGVAQAAADLNGGEELIFPEIGKLKVIAKAAREGRNPRTGAVIQVAAKVTVKFTASKVLKDALNS